MLFARVPRSRAQVDPNYSSALAAANQFLHAWQSQDHETEIMMLSDSVRQRVPRERLEEFFSPAAGAAFEIQHGRKLNASEYVFPVVLFGLSTAASRPHIGKIVMTRSGKDDWAVTRLP
jgi:hypothetical protein